MYDYDDYEEDVLLVLRVLKYLHGVQTREEFLKTLNHCTEAGLDELYELADTFTWELFPAAVFDIDEEWGATTMSFSHPNIDCYLSLTGRLDTTHGHRLALRKRLEDIALYFCMVTDSVTGVQFSPMDESTYVKLRFSPDCCDTLGFANSMVDLLRYLDRENRRLEKLCLEQQNESDKEAA